MTKEKEEAPKPKIEEREEAPEPEVEAKEEAPEPKSEPKPKTKPPLKKLPKTVDVVYKGAGAIAHNSTDSTAKDEGDNPLRYVFNPGVPVRVSIPYDIAKFCHLAWISSRANWEVLVAGTDEPLGPPMKEIPYPPRPGEAGGELAEELAALKARMTELEKALKVG